MNYNLFKEKILDIKDRTKTWFIMCVSVYRCVSLPYFFLLWLFNQKKLGRRKILFDMYSLRQSTIEGNQGRKLEGGTMASFLINPRTV